MPFRKVPVSSFQTTASECPPSPSPSFRPKARVNTDAAVRKLPSTSTLSASHSRNAPPTSSRSRPSSPFKSPRALHSGPESGSSSPNPRVTARPTSRSGISPVLPNLESRQRALTTVVSAKLRLPHSEDRPRSGSVAASPSDTSPPGPLVVDIRRTNTPPALAPIKVRSKLTGLVKPASVNPDSAALRSLSPPYATTRPIHTRARAPSITSANDPSSSVFYPITTASSAANPHRYAPLHAQPLARSYPSPTLPSEPHPTKASFIISKLDSAHVPPPPHSPPISALSFSSKSSVSKTSTSPNTDQTNNNHVPSPASHVKCRSMERISLSNPFVSQAEIVAQAMRDRSHSIEWASRDPPRHSESDVDLSERPEKQLRAEAKTNRKIADLEITNRSLLAINASLESTKNRQASEIRDLRRKLRESRLILPPRTYKAVQSALENEHGGHVEDEEDDDSDAEEGADETFQRIRGMVVNLVESGKKALEAQPDDFRASLTTRVLNADELRSWRGSGQRTSAENNYMDKQDQDADDKTIQGLLSPALVAIPDSDGSSLVDNDGEPAQCDFQASSVLPPITITHSL